LKKSEKKELLNAYKSNNLVSNWDINFLQTLFFISMSIPIFLQKTIPPTKGGKKSNQGPNPTQSDSAAPSATPSATPSAASPPTQEQKSLPPIDVSVNPFTFDSNRMSALRFEGYSGKIAQNLYIIGGFYNQREEIAKECEKILVDVKRSTLLRLIELKIENRQAFETQIKSYLDQMNASQFIRSIFEYLIRENALKPRILKLTVERYLAIMKNHHGIVEGVLVTTGPLSTRIMEDWTNKIQNTLLKPGQTLKLTHKIQPSIFGGYKVVLENGVYDFSYEKKFQNAVALKNSNDLLVDGTIRQAYKLLHHTIPLY